MTEQKKPEWWVEEDNNTHKPKEDRAPALEMKDGDVKEIEFINAVEEFLNKTHIPEGEPTLPFEVKYEGKVYTLYVKKKWWSVTNIIRGMGFPLKGKKAIYKRTGLGKKTEWHLEPIGE